MNMSFGNRMMQVRKQKGLSRETLAQKLGTSVPIVGRYERGDMMPSVEVATNIAIALEVSLDFLVGISSLITQDHSIIERLEELAQLPPDKQRELFNVVDAYIRDYKTGKAYKK